MTAKKDITTDETAARAYFEGIRWPNGPFCPHCGSTDKVYRLEGKSHRPGLFHCNACAGQFTVTTGSVMESSHIPLNKWAFGFRLYAASKKGFSAHQLHRMIGITYKSAWFMAHRIREAMDEPKTEPMGGSGKTVETDETFIGGLEKNRHNIKRKRMGTGQSGKETVASLVERGGKVRSFHIGEVTQKNLRTALKGHIHKDSRIVSDNAVTSLWVEREFGNHHTVSHKHKEYVRGDIHTNTIEGYFSILKRGIVGTYHHVSPQHLHRYLSEFDFRYSNRASVGVEDAERMTRAIKGAEGKRLMYRQARTARA